jgi:hypothetical protein
MGKPDRPIYRVWFEGADLDDGAAAALADIGAVWEGSEGSVDADDEGWRHSARLHAADASDAEERLTKMLRGPTRYRIVLTELVVDAGGEPWRAEIDRRWEHVDWSVPGLAELSPLERTVIWALLDDEEATWLVLREFDAEQDPADVERALRHLEAGGLVDHRLALGLEPGNDSDEPVPWWALTSRAWDLLGLIKSPRYRP